MSFFKYIFGKKTPKDIDIIPKPTYEELEDWVEDLEKDLEHSKEERDLLASENYNYSRRVHSLESTVNSLESNLDTYRSLTEKYEKEIKTLGDLDSKPDNRQLICDTIEEYLDPIKRQIDGLDIEVNDNLYDRIFNIESKYLDQGSLKSIHNRLSKLEDYNIDMDKFGKRLYNLEINSVDMACYHNLSDRVAKLEKEEKIVKNGTGGTFQAPYPVHSQTVF